MTNEKAIEILQSGAGVWPITDRANNAINKAIKALSQQTEDAISRILVQEEISKSITLKENPHQIWQRIQDLPSVTPKAEPCEDAISRQAALDEIISRLGISGEKYLLESERYIYQIIKDLPPVTPKQRTGHWIYDRRREWDGECKYECSECGMGSDVDYAYCMRCGAKMVEPQESEEQE